MVGAGTRKACAISSVESPPSVRSVSATCASGASAGWQHVKIRRRRSSGTGVSSSWSDSGADSSRCFAISSCFCTKRAPRRSRSIALCRPVETSHATGFAGVPASGHCSSATANASWSASSAVSMSPSRRMSVARIRPCSDRKISSMRGSISGKATPPRVCAHREDRLLQRSGYFGGPLRIGRTSIEKPASVRGCLATKASASSRFSPRGWCSRRAVPWSRRTGHPS